MKFALYLIAFVLVALIVPFLLPATGKQEGVDPNSNLPWQIALDGQGGSTVFGLQPGVSTLGEVRQRLGSEIEVAIIAEPNEVGTLEGYYAQVPLGFVLAKVIVTVDITKEAVSEMRERALKAKHMESMTRKITLHPDDLALAEQMPVRAISVIPTVNLDEATVVQRFGQPGERLVVSEKRTHLLYPQQGLDIVVDGDGKELLQYVAPRNFASLREPLLAVESAKTASQ
ncbi:hypothetical protein AT959_03395 [Dechloromonas denitrificans]|uniref:Uncharacterized protein n=1 Tax=Dechloromonas denitrificans TaxID=281362 RepID=A0A133XME8_9RHOO|nr:hypothetical protein [Dechloromonas denitrificans]KXB32115.1 hypothetical protein AT959_03395 [Dechloromonas denitrificans]